MRATSTSVASRSRAAGGRKTIKHALRQAKRRRRNAAGSPASIPRIIVKPLPPQAAEEAAPAGRTPTMREVLASIPGFTMKPRRRTNKKLSTAAQLEQTKEGCVDLETPDSILVNTNLRHLLNKATFASLPLLYQNKLVQLLPSVDRHIAGNPLDSGSLEINNSGLNNEFFARACLEWQDRLAEGEFTPENQQKLKLEADKERSKLDPWKLKHFEADLGRPLGPGLGVHVRRLPGPHQDHDQAAPVYFAGQGQARGPAAHQAAAHRGRHDALVHQHAGVGAGGAARAPKTPIPDLLPIRHVRQVQKDDVHPKAETKTATEAPPPSDTVELQEKCIVNISDTILENNEETIIICATTATAKAEKRKRSPSLDSNPESPKRRAPSPPPPRAPTPEPEPIPEPETVPKEITLEDVTEVQSEAPSDDDKVSEATSEPVEHVEDEPCDSDKEKMLDENSSSSSGLTAHNLEEISEQRDHRDGGLAAAARGLQGGHEPDGRDVLHGHHGGRQVRAGRGARGGDDARHRGRGGPLQMVESGLEEKEAYAAPPEEPQSAEPAAEETFQILPNS
ncbi:hypothetical protein NQ318_019773 [Aromia moschata]|uniref:DEUBAD domain-containing protein n=1 Tax=Aromia moschata TaxID=1265417 RepID=A0AAV8YJ21_9CUCU|nr:hypothetical protein NQ318_019773 [Aromia moschata]